jgi:SAM-dependent methyltransferase
MGQIRGRFPVIVRYRRETPLCYGAAAGTHPTTHMCTICKPLDASKSDAFGTRLLNTLNEASLAVMISLGHRSGLFDTMAILPPADSATLAGAAGLNERYVREWLGAMLTGGIVKYDPAVGTWRLPAEHAALLTRAAAPNNFAAFMQYIGQFGAVEDRVLDCFRRGGGVPYAEFKRFHEIMAEDSGQTVVPALFEQIIPLVPGLHERLEAGIDVLDLGCGRGIALRMLALRYPKSRFTGLDLSAEAIAWAVEQADEDELTNICYLQADAATFTRPQAFDLITTFDAIHDQARPDLVLANIARSLRPDGVYLMQDIRASSLPHENVHHPAGPFLYSVSTLHCMTVSLAAGGMGLGTCWGRQLATRMLAAAGFQSIRVEQLPHDFQNEYYIVRLSGTREPVAPAASVP